jgi:hypothetical protein
MVLPHPWTAIVWSEQLGLAATLLALRTLQECTRVTARLRSALRRAGGVEV